jgi:hypothetical protein
VDGAVDPAAAEQALIGGVDDGVDVELGNVALDDVDALGHGPLHARIGFQSRSAPEGDAGVSL